VISVNAWMNHPSGFKLLHGKVIDAHPWKALFGNTYLWNELIHMYLAGYMVSGFILAGVYAFAKLRGRWGRYERAGLAISLTIAVLASLAQGPVGDWAARDVATTQPVKLAAIEGLGPTTRGASEHLLGIYSHGKVKDGIGIPHLLSILAFHSWDAKVTGLDSVPPSQRPPVNVVRFAFQTMVGIGTLLVAISLFTLAVRLRLKRLPETPWFYRALIIAGPLSVVALIAGWVVTEVGRQPWVVYHVMPTADAVTGAPGIPIGYGALALVYAFVAAGVAWMLLRLAKRPLDLEPAFR
jgi:cytochrome bd ubiquinol oxidase subunit I